MVKPSLLIVAAGLVALAIAAVSAAHGPKPTGGASLAEAEAVVHEFIAAAGAVYESGGDRRAAEEVPAVPDLVSEMLADIAFSQHRLQAREWRQLIRVEGAGSASLPGGGAEVRTREFWIFRRGPLRGPGPEGPAASAISNVRYELAREGARWRVVDYRLEPAAPRAGARP